MEIETKICSTCKTSKKVSEFYQNKNNKDGLRGYCKECTAVYSRKYFLSNPDSQRKSFKKWYEKNKEKVAKSSSQWKQKNKYKVNNMVKEFQRKTILNYEDCYMVKLLKSQGYTKEEIEANPSLIEKKREELKAKRLKRADKNKPKTP